MATAKTLSSYLRSLFSFHLRHQQTKRSNFFPGPSLLSFFFFSSAFNHTMLFGSCTTNEAFQKKCTFCLV